MLIETCEKVLLNGKCDFMRFIAAIFDKYVWNFRENKWTFNVLTRKIHWFLCGLECCGTKCIFPGVNIFDVLYTSNVYKHVFMYKNYLFMEVAESAHDILEVFWNFHIFNGLFKENEYAMELVTFIAAVSSENNTNEISTGYYPFNRSHPPWKFYVLKKAIMNAIQSLFRNVWCSNYLNIMFGSFNNLIEIT